jgi:hypothetical protein
VYHLISRFVAQEWFVESVVERRTYLSLLGLALRETDWRCFSYAIMSNHLHFGLVAGRQPLAKWLRPLHSTFATWINQRRERIGGVFVRGPKLIEFRPNGTAELVNYIHRNPVRAGVVMEPNDSDWTSHRAYSGSSWCPPWLDLACGTALGGFASARTFASWIDAAETDRYSLELAEMEPRPKMGRPCEATAPTCAGAASRDCAPCAGVGA